MTPIFCPRCKTPLIEHVVYKMRIVDSSGYLMLDKIIDGLCYDTEAQEAAYKVKESIRQQGKFSASVELLKHQPDKKTEGGIILPH